MTSEDPTTTEPRPRPHSRRRRVVATGAGLVAFFVAGAATVWAVDGNAEQPGEPTATTVDAAATTSAPDHDHDTDSETDADVDHDADHDESVECDLPVETSSGDTDHGKTLHDSTGGRAVTEDDCENAEAFYDEVRAEAIARYSDLAVAEDAGYRISGSSAKSPSPLEHYLLAGGTDEVLDPTLPEGLIYWVDAETGDALLIGVVFLESGDDLPQPAGPLTVWHDHSDLESCLEMDPNCDVEADGANAPRMLHVWFFDGAVNVFANDFPGAVGDRGLTRDAPLPWEM